MRNIAIVAFLMVSITGCGGENSDGSDATTYSSCRISNSEALLASDRSNDLAKCWDGVDYKEQSTAQAWCSQQVSSYISSEYILGHTVEYKVASTNCLSTTTADVVTEELTGESISSSLPIDNNPVETNPVVSNPNPLTYSKCTIIESGALFDSDETYDLQQCWDGGDYEEQSLATAWCGQLVSNYIDDRYFFGHSVRYQVESGSCP
jgi:hypothetical protein